MSKMITLWGKRCKVQMAIRGMILMELSKTIGLTHIYVSAIINGRVVVPEETICLRRT